MEFTQIMGTRGNLAVQFEPLAADRKPRYIHQTRKTQGILTSGSGSGTLFGLQLKSSIDSTWSFSGPVSPAATPCILLRCSASDSLIPLPDTPLFDSSAARAREPPPDSPCALDPSLPDPCSTAGDRFTIHGNGAPLGDGGSLLGSVAVAKVVVMPSGCSSAGCLTRMYAPWDGGGGGREEEGEGIEEGVEEEEEEVWGAGEGCVGGGEEGGRMRGAGGGGVGESGPLSRAVSLLVRSKPICETHQLTSQPPAFQPMHSAKE